MAKFDRDIIIWNSVNSYSYFLQELEKYNSYRGVKSNSVIIYQKNNFIRTTKGKLQFKKDGLKEISTISELAANRCVFILIENDWYNTLSDFPGLEIAFDLMKSYGKDCPLNIHFVSLNNQKHVFNNAKGHHKLLVKQFGFITISDINTFRFRVYSNQKYRYYFGIIFNNQFLLNQIAHNLEKYSITNVEAAKEYLSNYVDILESKISNGIKKFIESSSNNNSLEFKHLQELKNLIINFSTANIDLIGSQRKQNYNCIIIDDSDEDIEILRNLVSLYFNVLEIFKRGDEALDYIDCNKGNINVVFLDQELLEDEGWDQVLQGMDVYEKLNKPKYKSIHTCIVTSYSRAAISSIYPSEDYAINFDKVLFKKNGFALDNEGLHNFFMRIIREIDLDNLSLQGPTTGQFASGYFPRRIIFRNDKNGITGVDFQEEVFTHVNNFFDSNNSDVFDNQTKKDEDFIKIYKIDEQRTYTIKLLVIRLIILRIYYVSSSISKNRKVHVLSYYTSGSKSKIYANEFNSLNNSNKLKVKFLTGKKEDNSFQPEGEYLKVMFTRFGLPITNEANYLEEEVDNNKVTYVFLHSLENVLLFEFEREYLLKFGL